MSRHFDTMHKRCQDYTGRVADKLRNGAHFMRTSEQIQSDKMSVKRPKMTAYYNGLAEGAINQIRHYEVDRNVTHAYWFTFPDGHREMHDLASYRKRIDAGEWLYTPQHGEGKPYMETDTCTLVWMPRDDIRPDDKRAKVEGRVYFISEETRAAMDRLGIP